VLRGIKRPDFQRLRNGFPTMLAKCWAMKTPSSIRQSAANLCS